MAKKYGTIKAEYFGLIPMNNGELGIVFKTNDKRHKRLLNHLETNKSELYNLEVSKLTNKRSLEQNNYMWGLITELVPIANKTKSEIYKMLISDYGIVEHLLIRKEALSSIKKVFKFVDEGKEILNDGKVYLHISGYIGTSNYDTNQMKRFLDGLIAECESVDIDTDPERFKYKTIS